MRYRVWFEYNGRIIAKYNDFLYVEHPGTQFAIGDALYRVKNTTWTPGKDWLPDFILSLESVAAPAPPWVFEASRKAAA